jgi:DNA-binding NarL/FixJ family response regulator
MEIARLVRDGRTNRQIARALGLSTKTVEAHLSRIFAKLSIPSRTVLAVLVTTGERAAA